MNFKVYGGTPTQEAETLCVHCRFSRIIRGHRLEEELVFCDATTMSAVRIKFKVASCSSFLDAREPTYPELVEKAWILKPGTRRRPMGFVRASDLTDDEVARMLMHREKE